MISVIISASRTDVLIKKLILLPTTIGFYWLKEEYSKLKFTTYRGDLCEAHLILLSQKTEI